MCEDSHARSPVGETDAPRGLTHGLREQQRVFYSYLRRAVVESGPQVLVFERLQGHHAVRQLLHE